MACSALASQTFEGEGEGRPGTHCIRMRRHSAEYMENPIKSGYCRYTYTVN